MVNAISPFQLQTAQQASELTNATPVQAAAPKSQTNFSDVLKNSIEALNQSQLKSDQYTNALAQGKDVNLDEVMIAAQKRVLHSQLQQSFEIKQSKRTKRL